MKINKICRKRKDEYAYSDAPLETFYYLIKENNINYDFKIKYCTEGDYYEVISNENKIMYHNFFYYDIFQILESFELSKDTNFIKNILKKYNGYVYIQDVIFEKNVYIIQELKTNKYYIISSESLENLEIII